MSSLSTLPIFPYNNSNLSYNKNTTPIMASIVNPLCDYLPKHEIKGKRDSRRCVLSRGYNDFLDAHECINDGDNLSYYDILESEVSASLDDYDRCCFLLDDEYDYNSEEYDNITDNCISSSYSGSDIDYLCLFCEDKSLESVRIAKDEYVSELLNNLETACCICGDKILDINLGYCDLCYADQFYNEDEYEDDNDNEYDIYDIYNDDYKDLRYECGTCNILISCGNLSGYCDLCYAECHCFDYDDGDYYDNDDNDSNSYNCYDYDMYSDF